MITTLVTDRRTELTKAAARRRLVSRSKAPPADAPTASVRSIVRPAEVDRVLGQQRAHCVA
jgi:hypothetical protein